MMFKRATCVGIIALILLLAVPLFVVFKYEEHLLGVENPEEIKIALQNARSQLGRAKQQNSNEFRLLEGEVKANWREQPEIMEKLLAGITSIYEEELFVNPALISSYYRSHYIINLQITPGFASQIDKIRSEVMRQLRWFKEEFGMNLNIVIWEPWMDLDAIESGIIIVVEVLHYEYLQENIALKLKKGEYRNHYYIKEIVQEVKSLPAFSHCEFTSTHCTQASIAFVSHPQPKEGTFWEADEKIYFLDDFDPSLLFNILADILDMSSLLPILELTQPAKTAKYLYQIIKNKSQQHQIQSTLNYISHIEKPTHFDLTVLTVKANRNTEQAFRYLKNGEFISPYLHNTEEKAILLSLFHILDSILTHIDPTQLLDQDILGDNRVGVIDIFPNDFKIGVYLPLLVIFLYPCILKLKEAATGARKRLSD